LEDNIKTVLKVAGFNCMQWNHVNLNTVEWRALLNTEITFGFYIGRGTLSITISFSRKTILCG
jgi:hypothetical protein